MSFIDVNDALKACLFDDEDAAARLKAQGVSGRALRLMRRGHRRRRAKRTDFGVRLLEDEYVRLMGRVSALIKKQATPLYVMTEGF